VDLPEIVIFIVMPLIVALVLLERRRQRRRSGKGSGTGTSLSRAGLLELQNLLEPERKIEALREMERKEDLLVEVDDEAGPAKP